VNALAGTRVLARLAFRRDRVFLPAWLYALTASVAGTGYSFNHLYATPASRHALVTGAGDTPATLALYGRIYADSVGGLTAWRTGLVLALAGLMSILLVVRHTRADEEAGRAELVAAAPVGRHAALAAALLVALAANAALALLVALGLIAVGLDPAGSLALGVSIGAAGCAFAAVAALAAQLAETAHAANAIAGAALGAAYLLRAVGDAGPHALSWLSPLGWSQQLRPFAGERWWVLAPGAALCALLVAASARLGTGRDLGAGLLPPRPGPAFAAAGLRSPLALAWRLQRGALAGWAAGFAILGAVLGSVASGIGDLVGDSPGVRKLFAELGGSKGIVDAYLATTLGVAGLIAAVYAVQATLRLRTEETGGLAEPLLATATSRTRWALSHATVAAGGTAALLVAVGFPAGVAHALQTGDAAQLWRVLGGALAQIPAAWVLAGVTLALFGLAPRATAASWAALAACLLLAELGPVIDLPSWTLDISPFAHVPKIGEINAAPFWLTAIAAALAAAGVAGLRRRDVG
jgi:ABC-2 type transport system permease protein